MTPIAIARRSLKAARVRTATLARLAAVVLLVLSARVPALAAEALPAAAEPAPAAASAAELESLVKTLRDDESRATLVRQLEALITARRQTAQPAAEPTDFVARLMQHLDTVAGELIAGGTALLDAPRLVEWASAQLADERARAEWAAVLLACAAIFGVALLAEWVSRRVLARVGRSGAGSEDNGPATRALLAMLGAVLDVLPVVAFGLGALAATAFLLPPYATASEAIRVLVWAVVGVRLVVAAAKAVLLPRPAWPSLVSASEETRNYIVIWTRRFAFWAIFGFAGIEAAWWLGAPGDILGVMQKSVGLVVATLAVVFVLQNRESVGQRIAGNGSEHEAGWRRLRRHLADTWHILAVIYIVGVYLVFSLQQQNGSGYVVRATALSLVALIGARLLVRIVERWSEHGFAVAPDLKVRFPHLEERVNRYLYLVAKVATVAIYAVAALAVLQAWNLGAFDWFETELGRRAAGAALSIAIVLLISLAAWEILSAAIERNLAALDQAGLPSRARRRTLLPLLRSASLCVIVVIGGLTVLSQLGINIAPLLAGAGVVGLAVGFGSQALIKDVITGLFILIEDQVAVGDIVDLGKEHAGVVEGISIRTIRLRDLSGIVHTVPFSEVTSIKNLTKDFAFVVARIAVAHGEDIDRVVEILRGVCDALAEDAELGPMILDRFDYLGVDSLNEFSVTLLLRVRTLPAKQWSVGRALNRRVNMAFTEHGIAIRDPAPVKIAGPSLAALAAQTAVAEPAAADLAAADLAAADLAAADLAAADLAGGERRRTA